MADIGSCLLEGHGVLPSAPTKLRYSNLQVRIFQLSNYSKYPCLQPTFAILHWEPPSSNSRLVTGYQVQVQRLGPGAPQPGQVTSYTGAQVQPPYILEHLEPRNTYEVLVKAASERGWGEASSRLVFRTSSPRQVSCDWWKLVT